MVLPYAIRAVVEDVPIIFQAPYFRHVPPTDDAMKKPAYLAVRSVYLTIREAIKKWLMPIKN